MTRSRDRPRSGLDPKIHTGTVHFGLPAETVIGDLKFLIARIESGTIFPQDCTRALLHTIDDFERVTYSLTYVRMRDVPLTGASLQKLGEEVGHVVDKKEAAPA